VKSLPDMIANANDLQLKQCLQSHLRESLNHVNASIKSSRCWDKRQNQSIVRPSMA
jgi:ferritin-like metal-binding protein YciE